MPVLLERGNKAEQVSDDKKCQEEVSFVDPKVICCGKPSCVEG